MEQQMFEMRSYGPEYSRGGLPLSWEILERNPNLPTSIDLFAGAGGITQGFHQAGFQCLYANDSNLKAMETFSFNHPCTWVDAQKIENVNPAHVRRELKIKKGQLTTLVGGPPCQGFSINAPDRFIEDSRNALFKHYVRFLDEFRPQTFLFENVPGMLSLASGKIFNQIMDEFSKHGYTANAKILFAAHYGVPQERWRLIILGTRKNSILKHPEPTHYAVARANFRGGRTMTFQLTQKNAENLLSSITVGEAISDLPKLETGEGSEEIMYDREACSEYAKEMRSGQKYTFNHFAARLSKQNKERMKYIKPGGSWRDIPYELLPKGMKRARRSDHTKRYGRLSKDGLSGTIMTKCDPHWGAVFLPDQDRTLTVREAARLQSFPDYYRFLGSRVSQYEQVGNAVPVLMATAIAQKIITHITSG